MKETWIEQARIVLRQLVFTKKSLATAVLFGAGLLLVACGKVGSLERPDGDWNYPHQYPYPPAVTPNAPNGAAEAAPDENPLPESLSIRKNSRIKTKTYGQ
ncbi:hypothetical protein [Kiloniella antarctica]|uniref:Lipoprotein n=1 Tax=Kiloniella antarctica TaxID=1550907 RepID=A0ABW5BHR3_9PROT